MRAVVDFAAKRAELSADSLAFEEIETGRRITFADFNQRAERCAAAFERLAIAPGDRVAILCHNSATFFEILFGCGKIGAILVPLNWRQTPAELSPIAADCGARLLLHDGANASLAQAVTRTSDLRVLSFQNYETLIAEAPPAWHRDSAWAADRIWYLLDRKSVV